jgi:hypothetical protein
MRGLSSSAYFGGVDLSQFGFVGFHGGPQEDVAKLSAILSRVLDSDLHVNSRMTLHSMGGRGRGDGRMAVETPAMLGRNSWKCACGNY